MSTGSNQPFAQSGVVSLAASTTSAAAALVGSGDTLLVTNATAALAWIALGGAGSAPVAAVGNGYPVLPGQRRIIGSGPNVTQVAVILVSGTGSIVFETGTGSAT